MKALLTRLKRIFWINFTFEVFQRFGKDNGGLMAAGLAFFLVLAFVPLLLVGLWALGQIYAHRPDQALQKIIELLQTQIFPGAAGKEVQHLMWRAGIAANEKATEAGPTLLNILKGHGIAGMVGFLGVVWASIQIFVNGSVAMNAAWETQEKRNWFQLRALAFGLLLGTGILLVLSLVVTAVSTAVSSGRFAGVIPYQGALVSGLFELGAVVVSALMYATIYKFLPSPSAHVSWRAALIGGFLASVAFEIAKKGLSVYLISQKQSLYGELGNLISFILWIYYSMMILLLGAEVSVVYSRDVEQGSATRLKRTAAATPASAATASSRSPLSQAKQKERAQRLRKNGGK